MCVERTSSCSELADDREAVQCVAALNVSIAQNRGTYRHTVNARCHVQKSKITLFSAKMRHNERVQ